MYKNIALLIYVYIFIIVASCSPVKVMPGTSGKSSAKKIVRTGHREVPEGLACYTCHKSELPSFELHKKFGNKCGDCHDQTTWMAVKYPHTEWPLNKNHTVRCTRCHTTMDVFDFKVYECWGCHHDELATVKIHAEKGKNNISSCAECHKKPSKT